MQQTAIYGSSGANGIILITTKKGTGSQTGKPVVNINVYAGASNVTRMFGMLQTPAYVHMPIVALLRFTNVKARCIFVHKNDLAIADARKKSRGTWLF